MKILLLASGKLAQPAFYQLSQMGIIGGLCLPTNDFEGKTELLQAAQFYQIPTVEVAKNDLHQKLTTFHQQHSLGAAVILSFKFIIRSKTLNLFHGNWFNIHFGELPQYAGAQPLFWQLKNKEPQCVITAHKVTTQVDQGPVAYTHPVGLTENDTFASAEQKLAIASSQVILGLLQGLQANTLTYTPASKAEPLPAPQFKDVCINWNTHTAAEIKALCNACNPWNKGAITFIHNQQVKIIEVQITGPLTYPTTAGSVIPDPHKLLVASIDGFCVEITVMYTDIGILSGTQYHHILNGQLEKFSVSPY